MFEAYDKSNGKTITLENWKDMFKRLKEDEIMLGKIPDITED